MQLTFLGTGAATACPLPFCRCDTCASGRAAGGRDVRLRASALIDGQILIDLGPDAVGAAAAIGADLTLVKWWLQTHAHSDHFDAGHLATRLDGYMGQAMPEVTLIASRACMAAMSSRLAAEAEGATLLDAAGLARLKLRAIEVEHGAEVALGPYRVLAVEAARDRSGGPLLYAVERSGAALLYATDTEQLPESAWARFRAAGLRFGLVAIDHTYGPGVDGGGHLNADGVARTVRRLADERLLAPGAAVYATHISHENPPHAALAVHAGRHGYRVAWDGLTVRVPGR